jgi:hypothetical protein
LREREAVEQRRKIAMDNNEISKAADLSRGQTDAVHGEVA